MSLIGERFKNAYNAFKNGTPQHYDVSIGSGSSYRLDKNRSYISSKSDVKYIYNHIAVYASSVNVVHMRTNEDGKYEETINDSLNKIFTRRANIDQTGRDFVQDIIQSLLEEGTIAIVPIDTDVDPDMNQSFKVYSARRGKILEWYPKHILVEVYDDNTGLMKELLKEKRVCPIITNPFYSIMNESNSTAQRLMRILSQLDKTNEQNSAGKMDMIIQLPYVIKNPAKRREAERRRKDIEAQLTNSQYGIAYIDGTEKIVQLNRSIENNLWDQYNELKVDFMNQLGMTEDVFNGTADEQTLVNFNNHTIKPLLTALVEAVDCKWISETAKTQGQAIGYYEDPFKLIPVSKTAEMADKLTRNEIMSSNEIRASLGLKPSKDPKADELRNANLNHPDEKDSTNKTEIVENVVEEIQNQ